MSGMKRNMNLGLLILIIALLVCFSAASIYYQSTYKVLVKESKTKLSELQKVTSVLFEKKEELAETSAKKETLETKYTDIKTEKETIEDELDTTKTNLESARNELLQTKDELRREKDLSLTYLSQRDEYKSQSESFQSDLNSVCSDVQDAIDGGALIDLPNDCPE